MNTNTLGGGQRQSLTLEPIHMYTPGTFRHIYIHSPKVTLYLLNSDSFSRWGELPCYCTVEAASVSVSALTTRLQASERPPVSYLNLCTWCPMDMGIMGMSMGMDNTCLVHVLVSFSLLVGSRGGKNLITLYWMMPGWYRSRKKV